MRRKHRRLVLFNETDLSKQHIASLKLVILAVAFGTVNFNIIGGIAMTGYLKQLGTSDFLYGVLYAMSPIATVLQILVSYLLERTKKRKFFFIAAGLLQRTIWLPFGMVPFFVPESMPSTRLLIIAIFMSINALTVPFMNVSFFSFFADIVPHNIRGHYIAVRQRISTVVGIFGGLLTAWMLDRFTGFNGYALVFSLAAVFGVLDIVMFFKIKFPPMADTANSFKIKHMLIDVFKNKQFVKITSFVTFWIFSFNLSAPFYLVYAKTVLNLTNTTITLAMQILTNISSVIVLSMWGRSLDKFGNRPVIGIAAKMASFAPLIWFFITPGAFSVVLVSIVSISTGLFAIAVDVGAQNMFLGKAPQKNRSMYVAIYLSTTSIIGVGFANAAGGWLLDNVFSHIESLNFSLIGLRFNRYNYLFLLTFFLRMSASFLLLPRLLDDDNTPEKIVLSYAKQSLSKRIKYFFKREL